jgi:hypothetical protein
MNAVPKETNENASNGMDLLEKLNQLKEEYYSENSKNTFFKNSQKQKIAKEISEQFDLNILIQRTAFILPNTASIYVDYTVFKHYANENNYHNIIQYVIQLINYCIHTYGFYEIHSNLSTFTISAAERYKQVFYMFNTACLSNTDINYSNVLKVWYIYHPPNVIDVIYKFFKTVADPLALSKLIIVDKNESEEKIKELFSGSQLSSKI